MARLIVNIFLFLIVVNNNAEAPVADPQVEALHEIAKSFGSPAALTAQWRGNDACADWPLVTCDAQKNIIIINLAKNNFKGTISSAFGNLKSLQKLLLNDNNLTGPIPNNVATLPQLVLLDVSNNNLSGKLPHFGPSLMLTVRPGNPLLQPGVGTGGRDGSASGGSTPWGIVAGIITALVFIAILAFILYKIRKQKRTVRIEGENKMISLEVLIKATGNFSEGNIIGKGGFGVVYKGQLADGTDIAVKRLKDSNDLQGFQAEIEVLNKVRHRNVVSLLGYCVSSNERMLVYEYMPNGTLAENLFEGRHTLTWQQRLIIALDVARGVQYLHGLGLDYFIHRDLKPENILLGENLKAKVADFGLIKEGPAGTSASVKTKVMGTPGYICPEYLDLGKVTKKADVYAFGVILIELLTGRRATDQTLPPLVPWFHGITFCKENVDGSLEPDEQTMSSFLEVAKVALQCTVPCTVDRPNMNEVVSVLGPLVEPWSPAEPVEEGPPLNFHLEIHGDEEEGSSSLLYETVDS